MSAWLQKLPEISEILNFQQGHIGQSVIVPEVMINHIVCAKFSSKSDDLNGSFELVCRRACIHKSAWLSANVLVPDFHIQS